MCACARQASAEVPENNGSLLSNTPESERTGERPDRCKITQEQTSLNLRGGGVRVGRWGGKSVQEREGRDGRREECRGRLEEVEKGARSEVSALDWRRSLRPAWTHSRCKFTSRAL